VLTGDSQLRLSEELCRGGSELPPGTYQGLVPRGGRMHSLHGTFVLERSTRAPESMETGAPVLLSPRNTLVAGPRPRIVWTQVPGAEGYLLKMQGDRSFSIQLPATEVQCLSATGEERRRCSVPYPASEPDLPPGAYVLLQVLARSGESAPWRGEQENLWLRRFSSEKAGLVVSSAREIADLPIGDAARQLLKANLYAENEAYADAIELYCEFLAGSNTPEVRVTLADAYLAIGLLSMAERTYRETAGSDAGPAARAAAELGLGYVESNRGRFDLALSHFRKAREIYTGLGLKEESSMAEKAAADAAARERSSEQKR
jgi:hypothetical protein